MGYITLPRKGERVYIMPDIVYPSIGLPENCVGAEHLTDELKEKILTASVDEEEDTIHIHPLNRND